MGYVLSHLEHADDMVLLSRSWQGLQRQLDRLAEWCALNFLRVNGLKSAAMIFGPISPYPSRRPTSCLTLSGEQVPWRSQHKYVGIWFDSTTRDIFRAHYEHKHAAAAFVYWKTILGCDLYVGRGRLPPDVACQLYYALIDCHLTHGCDIMLDVDSVSFAWLENLNRAILRRMLGVGTRSGIPQLYSELGIYPLAVRRLELALRYLKYLVPLGETHLAKKALLEADHLRRRGKASWMGDLAHVMRDLPFDLPRLPSLANLSVNVCDGLIESLRTGAKQWILDQVNTRISTPLLHNRLEPFEKGPSKVVPICRRHYLTRVSHTEHRLALTRLLCASFFFRGLRSHPESLPEDILMCRKCGDAYETPGHVFMQCMSRETVEARVELRQMLAVRYGVVLEHGMPTREEAEARMRELIFNWNTVVPMARFIYRVCRSWKWFGRKLPTMVTEVAPNSDDEWEDADEDGFED
ncbi:hypothetical protein C8F01DRAFT_989662 [Mycena amicta]|nr:hypothetical protein C8F01DRAFT_989662 [Mycena amicta]